jgi:metal-responsive CopG/Arc/MetJ family transcriptional regulator
MRHSVSIRDEIGKEVESVAEEEGLSISEFYARAAESYLKRIRRRRAVDELDRRAGTIELRGDLDDILGEMRRDDSERP